MTTKTQSKQLGHLIGRLIGVAREVESLESEEKATLYDLSAVDHLADQVAALQIQNTSLKQQIIEVRRQKLANFSIEDISKELDRRKSIAFKTQARLSRARRSQNST